MTNISTKLACLALLSSTAACMNGEPAHDGADDSFLSAGGKSDTTGVAEGTPQARAVLRVANGASYATLHDVVGLYAPAAKHVIAYRAGADGTLGTADDRVIATLAELDAIPYIGPVSFGELVDYAGTLTWQDWVPATFSWSLQIATPVTAKQWSSLTPSDPAPGTPGTAKTVTLSVALSGTGGASLTASASPRSTTIPLSGAGNFDLSYDNSGVTADQRNIYDNRRTLTGQIAATGEVEITQYSEVDYAGNSIYGYNGTTTKQAGEAYVGLAFVDPASR